MVHQAGHDPFGPGKDLSSPKTFQTSSTSNPIGNFFSGWRLVGDGKPSQPAAPVSPTRDRMDTAIANALVNQQNKQAQATGAANAAAVPFAQRGMPATLANLEGLIGAQQGPRLGAPITTTTSPGFVRQTPAQRAAIAAQEAAATQRALEAALAISEYGVPDPSIRRFGPDLSPLEFADPNAVVIPPGNGLPIVCPVGTVPDGKGGCVPDPNFVPAPLCGENQIEINGVCHDLPPGTFGTNPPGDIPVSDTMRSLFGELSTADFTEQIAQAMADRAANLRGLDAESRARLAATVARRMTQIGSVETDLAANIASREADRLAQQEALAGAVGTRAAGFVGDTTASLTAAREALGPQVTDEFERVAQIVESQARSQGVSSQDAMARLGQVANMVAQERAAAPGQLAAESELALGDEEFAISNQLQQNLSAGLAGLDAEEAERLLAEAIRVEQFSNERDRGMINALVGNLIREDTQAFQAGQADLSRGFSKSEREAGELFRTSERLGSETFADLQARAGEDYRTSERIAGQEFTTGEREAAEASQTIRDAIKTQTEAKTAALVAQGDAAAAAAMGYDAATWAGMTDGMKSKAMERAMENSAAQAIGQWAAPAGSMQQLRETNPGLPDEYYVHVQELAGIEAMYADDPDGAAKAKDAFYKDLQTDAANSYGSKGYGPKEIRVIKQLYDEFKLDLAQADSIEAEKARIQEALDRFAASQKWVVPKDSVFNTDPRRAPESLFGRS